jgi:predicted metal-dependent peptidase
MSTATASPLQRKEKLVITPAIRKKAEDVIRKAKVQLAIHHPFFAQIVFGRKINMADNVSTAYITPRGHITVGTGFVSELSVQQCVFLLAHESMHYAMLHSMRRVHRKPRKWNVACDAAINDLLQEAKVGEFIPGGIDMKGSKDKTSEKIYEELPDQGGKGKGKKGKGQGGDGDGDGDGDPDYQPGEGLDDLEDGGEHLDEAEIREIEAQARSELAAAAQVARQQGKMPASMDRVIGDIISPPTPWHVLLERFMTALIKAGYSWKRPNKRFIGGNLYLPSADTEPKMGPVVVVVDTSGSIGPQELNHFLGHINSILEKCRPEKMYVIPCDAQVYKHTEYTTDDLPITPQAAKDDKLGAGGGGTSFKPPFRWVEEQGIEPDVLIYLTDMYGDFPDKAPDYQTVWLSIAGVDKAPFGDVIRYGITHEER